MPLSQIIEDLYAEQPNGVLYHYMSLGTISKVVESRSLLATDIRYFNDLAEMNHTAALLRNAISERQEQVGCNGGMLSQFQDWLSDRIADGNMQYVSCFTGNGNLLSQWRGYCPSAGGVSVGFKAEKLCSSAAEQNFGIGKCVYSSERQQRIAAQIVEAVEQLADADGENTDRSKRHPANSFFDVFEKVETCLLKIAALLKHPSFHEEQEWRVVSPVIANYMDPQIEYRDGISMLIPYIRFYLPKAEDRQIDIEHVYLGPTPHIQNSMTSLSRYLSKSQASPRMGESYCQLPYRAW